MAILLKQDWVFFSTASDDNGNPYPYAIYSGDTYEFDEATRTVVHSPDVHMQALTQPANYSRNGADEFYVWLNGFTRTGYFHNGAGGFTTKVITAVLTSQGSNCYAASTVLLLASQTTTDYTGPFTYLWDNAAAGSTRGPVPAGGYHVTVTDVPTGAAVTATVQVGQYSEITLLAALSADTIAITASGGTAPYTYAWADGATTATRTGLGTGSYTVVVRDVNGCTTAKTIVFDTSRFFFSRNPVVLDLQAVNLSGKPHLRFLCEVWVEEVYLSGTFTNIAGVLTQPADAFGRTTFDVSTLLDAYVQPDFPAYGESGVHLASKAFKRFYLQHSEAWDGSPVATYIQRDTHYLVFGGLDFFEYASQGYFTVYRPTMHPFLTWEPGQKEVFADQPEYLYYHHDSDATGNFSIRVTFTSSAGVVSTALLENFTGVARFAVFRAGVGLPQLRAKLGPVVPADLVAWEVAAVNDANVAVTETRYFQLSDELPIARRYFLYANSIGGVNTLATQGKAKTEMDFTNVLVQRTLQPNYRADAGESYATNVAGVPILSANTGYLTPAQMAAINDCLLSEEIRYVDTDRYRPCSLQPQSTVLLHDDDAGLLSLELVFVLPTLHRYTPALPLNP